MRDADQRVTRGAASIGLRNDYGATSGALNFFYNWGHHWINDGYSVAPESTAGPLPYRFISDDNMMGISWYQSARLFNGNRLTAGVDYFRFGGKAYNKFVEGDKMGQDTQIVDKKQDEIAGYLSTTQDFGRWITLNAGIRADHHSDIGTEWISQAGVVFHLPSSADLKLSASKGFRYPIIREMYMFPPQNPDLKPESMWNYELSFAQRLLNGVLTYSISAYYIKGKNLIVTVPRQGATPLNMNIGKVENTGVDLQAAYRASCKWSFNANYSYLHQKSPVPGAPEHKLYAGVTFTPDRFRLSTGLQYINNLYTTVATGANDANNTENFLLWNVTGSYRLNRNVEVWARGENLLAQRYEINAGYPMPRATVFAGVRVNF